jgi:hypothetical protein
MMKYGNCLTGAAFLMWRERNNDPRFILKIRPGTKVPHFMVKSGNGLHHYRVSKEILPWPLCYIVFQGRFQTVTPNEEETFDKRKPF